MTTQIKLWIKNVGASEDRLRKRWFEQLGDDEFRTHVRFSDAYRPTGIARNDRLLFHAFVEEPQGRLVAVVRVSDDVAHHDPREPRDQWPWRLAITPLLVVPLAGLAPTLADIGIHSPPMGSHKRIDPQPFAAAVHLMAAGALPEGWRQSRVQ